MDKKDIINMDYQVGDRVKVKDDLRIFYDYDGISFVPSMEEYLGKMVTISSVKYDWDKVIYKLVEDSEYNYWSEKMFENMMEG